MASCSHRILVVGALYVHYRQEISSFHCGIKIMEVPLLGLLRFGDRIYGSRDVQDEPQFSCVGHSQWVCDEGGGGRMTFSHMPIPNILLWAALQTQGFAEQTYCSLTLRVKARGLL